MSKMSPTEMAQILAKGLLSFPVTHFDQDFRFQEGPYREHCAWLLSFKRLTGLFAAGGTGEVFSLTPAEIGQVVTAAVKETNGRTPVIAGCAFGTATAVELAKAAEAAGADGLLLFPPYLMVPNQEGLMAHVQAVRPQSQSGRLQGWRRRHRADDADLRQAGRSPYLCRRLAHRGSLRPPLS